MRRSAARTLAVVLSSLLLVGLTGAAIAATGTAPALTSAVNPTVVPAQAEGGILAPGVQITATAADGLVRQREAAYQAQLDELTRRIQAGQERVAVLAGQEQAINDQLAQLQEVQSRLAQAKALLGQ